MLTNRIFSFSNIVLKGNLQRSPLLTGSLEKGYFKAIKMGNDTFLFTVLVLKQYSFAFADTVDQDLTALSSFLPATCIDKNSLKTLINTSLA